MDGGDVTRPAGGTRRGTESAGKEGEAVQCGDREVLSGDDSSEEGECLGCATGCDADAPHLVAGDLYHPRCCTRAAERQRAHQREVAAAALAPEWWPGEARREERDRERPGRRRGGDAAPPSSTARLGHLAREAQEVEVKGEPGRTGDAPRRRPVDPDV